MSDDFGTSRDEISTGHAGDIAAETPWQPLPQLANLSTEACAERTWDKMSGYMWRLVWSSALKGYAAIVSAALVLVASAIQTTVGATEDNVKLPARVENTILQEGNDQPKALIQTKSHNELTGNGIGDSRDRIGYPTPCSPDANATDAHIDDLGLTWARVSIDRLEWEPARSLGAYSQFQITRCQDRIVSLLAGKGVTILHTIVHWDEELHAERPPDYGNEEEVQLYLDYVRLIVGHFKDRIQYYEILNEAHVYVGLPDYINLVRRAVGVIREEYPEAKIVAGGASGLFNSGPRDFLFGFLESDVMPLIDAINIHPLYGESPEFDETRDYYENYPALVQEIKDVAEAHGFSGEYIAEEMTWRTKKNSAPLEPWVYPSKVAAKYYARAIVMHRGLGLWAGIAGEAYDTIAPIVRSVRNLSTILDGAEPEALAVEIESEATNVLSYGFIMPNGNRLFALWTNGTAVKKDPGIATTLTFPDFIAEKVIAFDVLNGFRQKLIMQQEGGNLVIRDLLVKDYPILIRLRL